MTGRCLNEEDLIELFYAETQTDEARTHLSQCSGCQKAFAAICNELVDIDMQVPDGGYRAVKEALALIDQKHTIQASEIITLDELAQWLKVSNHNIHNMLHQLPHTIIDGHIRFDRNKISQFLFGGNSGAEMKAPYQPRHRLISLPGRKAG